METDKIAAVETAAGWREFAAAVEAGRTPHAVIAVTPRELQEFFAERYARIVLATDKGWLDGKHPDLIFAGSPDKSPSIEECRTLNEQLAMHPVIAQKRLAVIWDADRLSLPAENSLLKLTEEPPASGCLLFVSEENKLLPTIKSRAWLINVSEKNAEPDAERPPENAQEWAAWLEKTSSKKTDTEMILREFESWTKYYEELKLFERAMNLDAFTRSLKNFDKRATLPILQDAAFAVIQGDISCEQIFGNLR